jgi:transcriptional regulator with XRE-family HTH domain
MIAEKPSGVVQQVLAANLRRLRIARRLSLSELARATAISKATLSGVENGRSNPTVDTLAALADALQVSLSELLEEVPPGEIRIVRAVHGGPEHGEDVVGRHLDEVASAGRLELTEIALEAHATHEVRPMASGAWAHVYVIQGKLIAGPIERSTELASGDYAAFPADVPHAYEAGRHPARALLLTHATA